MEIILGLKDLPRTAEMALHIVSVFYQAIRAMVNCSHIGRTASTEQKLEN